MILPLFYTDHPQLNVTNSEQPVVVLIHGLFGNCDNLSVIRRELQKHFRVISLDLPDHGKSPWSQSFSFEKYAIQVGFTLNSLNIPSAHIVGHSLGGKIAMYLSSINPLLIKSLTVLDIAPVAYEPRHENVIKGLTSVNLKVLDRRQDAQLQINEFIKEPSTQAFLLKSLYQEDGEFKWRFNLNMLVRDYAELSAWPLKDKEVFKGKVLFIKGKNSDYITLKHQSTITTQFPAAEAKIVDAGHWLHAEKPQVVNMLITKHLLG